MIRTFWGTPAPIRRDYAWEGVQQATNNRRTKALPELPTIAEAGVPGFELINW
jgi:hypothetical protein